MQTTLGGDRIGSGNKQELSLRNFERSTHDLSKVFRSTMACGTLVPFYNEMALPGDNFKINLETLVKTNPTIAPLFGSFKVQLDMYLCPLRLFQGALQMNKINVGMDMSKVKFPQVLLKSRNLQQGYDSSHEQINSSSIMSYFDIRGLGNYFDTNAKYTQRQFSAFKWLFYWEIYKNYYANKQEEIGAVIHSRAKGSHAEIRNMTIYHDLGTGNAGSFVIPPYNATALYVAVNVGDSMLIEFDGLDNEFDPQNVYLYCKDANGLADIKARISLTEIYQDYQIDYNNERCYLWNPNFVNTQSVSIPPMPYSFITQGWEFTPYEDFVEPRVETFPLENIEKMREKVLSAYEDSIRIEKGEIAPYGLLLDDYDDPIGLYHASIMKTQEGLALKTYQSDLFNNWVSTEWITGVNGINEITKINTSGGSFTIDELVLSRKIYDMLNRIAVTGGTYDDWLEANYTHDRSKAINSPMYIGGLSRELVFEEVTSNASSNDQPLGTLAGKGRMAEKKKGGYIDVRVDEPSLIMGIISITPRLDYSQGNKWDNNLLSFDDLHKPMLDGIGFQDLVTDQMAAFDTDNDIFQLPRYRSAGKQPSWINYMTNVNNTYGNFAVGYSQEYMVLNRKYEAKISNVQIGYNYSIKDLTTYIDPVKYNNIFAYTMRDAQNYWVQVAIDVEARRKMSAKQIPNL